MEENKMTDRRGFLSACGLAGAALTGVAAAAGAQQPPSPRSRNSLRRGAATRSASRSSSAKRGSAHATRRVSKFAYPADQGRMCEWLQDSMSGAIRVLKYGGTMPWLYEGTRYKKVIDPDGVTTEFIRCPDPTDSGVVAKITRTRV